MTSRDFIYWLQGYLEIGDPKQGIQQFQVDIIKNHLNMVFIHEIDPSYPKEQQEALNVAHSEKPIASENKVMRC